MIMEENINKLADFRVQVAMEKFKNSKNGVQPFSLIFALGGTGDYKLEVVPGLGHNYYMILEAMYRYRRQNPNDRIEDFFQDSLIKWATIADSAEIIVKILNVIIAELDYEKNGQSPFKINITPIMFHIKNNVKNINNQKDLSNLINYDNYLNENYGQKIL